MGLDTLRAAIQAELTSRDLTRELTTSQFRALYEIAYPEKVAAINLLVDKFLSKGRLQRPSPPGSPSPR